MMNVAVNGRFLARPITGVERYASELLRCLPGEARLVFGSDAPVTPLATSATTS